MKLGIKLGLFSLATFLFTPVAFSSELPEPGEKCSKVGQSQIYKGKKYTCIKLGQKRLWDNGSKNSTLDSWPKNPRINEKFLNQLTGLRWEKMPKRILSYFPPPGNRKGFWTSDSKRSCWIYTFETWGEAKGFATSWVTSYIYDEYGELISYVFSLRSVVIDKSNDLSCTDRITSAYGGEKVG